MGKLSPYAKLDLILGELGTPKSFEALKKTFPDTHPEINHALLEQGIEKLREDGYVYVVDNKEYKTRVELEDKWMIRRSFKGEMLVLENGYVTASLQKFRLKRDERRRQRWMIFGTVVAGVGALALVVWEMYAFFHEKVCH